MDSKPVVRYDEDSPPSWTNSIDVQIQANFIKIIDIDTVNHRFQAEALVETKWLDPSITSLSDKFDEKTMWKPEIYVENGVKDMKEEVSYKLVNADDSNDVYVKETRRVRGIFWENIEMEKHFPLDVQNLSVYVTTKKPGNIIQFQAVAEEKSISVRSLIDPSAWKIENWLNISFVRLKLDLTYGRLTYPGIKITARACRVPYFFYWNHVLPIFLVTLASVAPFTVDMKLPQSRLPATASMLLTSVGMRWTIGRFLPTVSYLTSIDKYSIGSIVLIVAQLVYHAVISALFPSLPSDAAYFIDKIAFTFFISVIMFKQILFILWIAAKTRSRSTKIVVIDSNDGTSLLDNSV